MAIDPRYLDPAYYASLPVSSDVLPQIEWSKYVDSAAYPAEFDQSQINTFLSLYRGEPFGLMGSQFVPFDQNYVLKPPESVSSLGGDGTWNSFGYRPLNEFSKYFDFTTNDPIFSSLSPTAQTYLQNANTEARKDFDVVYRTVDPANAGYMDQSYWSPDNIAAQFTPQDYAAINTAVQPYRTAQQLYIQEMLRRAQDGGIDIDYGKDGGIFGAVMGALPAIVGTMAGGPIGGAVGGAISGGLSGGGLQGALTGALTGGISGAGGIGNVLGSTGLNTSSGLLGSITGGLRNIADSPLNPFGLAGGALQGMFGVNDLTTSLGSALSLGGPGATIGGALGGTQGAIVGGLGGGLLGLGMDGELGGLLGNNTSTEGATPGNATGTTAGAVLDGLSNVGGLVGAYNSIPESSGAPQTAAPVPFDPASLTGPALNLYNTYQQMIPQLGTPNQGIPSYYRRG